MAEMIHRQTNKASFANTWATVELTGSVGENAVNILDVLDRGRASSAKVIEGTNAAGETRTFVVIYDYSPLP